MPKNQTHPTPTGKTPTDRLQDDMLKWFVQESDFEFTDSHLRLFEAETGLTVPKAWTAD